jgi:hypothetical protein
MTGGVCSTAELRLRPAPENKMSKRALKGKPRPPLWADFSAPLARLRSASSGASGAHRWCLQHGGGHHAVDVYSPRHSARPFHHIRSSTACFHSPHPPITLAPAALPPAARATSFAPSPVPSSLLLSSSPTPLSAAPAQHAVLCCLLCGAVHCAARACPQRPEGAPAEPEATKSPGAPAV